MGIARQRAEDGLLGVARTYGFTRGVVGGSRLWMVLGGAAYVVSAARWALKRDVEVVFSEEVRPGERLVITPIARPKDRRRSRRR